MFLRKPNRTTVDSWAAALHDEIHISPRKQEKALRSLENALDDTDEDVCVAAAISLCEWCVSSERNFRSFGSHIYYTKYELRDDVRNILMSKRMVERCVTYLTTLVTSSTDTDGGQPANDPIDARRLVYALGMLGHQAAVEPLIAIYKEEQLKGWGIVQALARQGGSTAVDFLLKELDRNNDKEFKDQICIFLVTERNIVVCRSCYKVIEKGQEETKCTECGALYHSISECYEGMVSVGGEHLCAKCWRHAQQRARKAGRE